jgi:hypothetical protein
VSKTINFFVFHHLVGRLVIFGGAMEMVFVYGGARFLGCVIVFLVVFSWNVDAIGGLDGALL